MSKILLTEESIGQVFDVYHGVLIVYHINKIGCHKFEIALKNKAGYWQGYINLKEAIEDLQFDDYGIERYEKNICLKPQREI